jgi:hypothetical protein
MLLTTGIGGLQQVVFGITWQHVAGYFTNLDNFMASKGSHGVFSAITLYSRLDEAVARVRRQPSLNAASAAEMFVWYLQAVGYERTNRGVLVALMPKTYRDIVLRALRTVGEQALGFLPPGTLTTAVKGLWEIAELYEKVDGGIAANSTLQRRGVFRQYFEDKAFATRLVESIRGWIEEWALEAVRVCAPEGVTTRLVGAALTPEQLSMALFGRIPCNPELSQPLGRESDP